MTTVLLVATTTPRSLWQLTLSVSTTRGKSKSDNRSAFHDRNPPIPSKSDDSSAFRDHFDCQGCATLANALRRLCERACRHKHNDFWSPPGPLDPNLKTGTLLRGIRENDGGDDDDDDIIDDAKKHVWEDRDDDHHDDDDDDDDDDEYHYS